MKPPLQCQAEAARFATTTETATERTDRIRRHAVVDAVQLLGRGPEGRADALYVMLAALHVQSPLTFRQPIVYAPLRSGEDFATEVEFMEWLEAVQAS